MSKYTFKLLYGIDPIVTSFIPVEETARIILYNYMRKRKCGMPKYELFERKNMRKQDMLVLTERVFIEFEYNGKVYDLNISPGFCFDGASVPKALVHGDLNKFSQAVELPSLVHDVLFNLQLMPFEDANNVFEGLLESTGLLKKSTIALYMFGVRSPVGRRLYNENKPETSWMKDYVKWTA